MILTPLMKMRIIQLLLKSLVLCLIVSISTSGMAHAGMNQANHCATGDSVQKLGEMPEKADVAHSLATEKAQKSRNHDSAQCLPHLCSAVFDAAAPVHSMITEIVAVSVREPQSLRAQAHPESLHRPPSI
jgi:hypothetical protein